MSWQPTGSMLQMRRSRRSSRSAQPRSSLLAGTRQSCPSVGRQSSTVFGKGRYWTSCSRSSASVSAAFVSSSPSDRTRWPTGWRESRSQASMVTRIRRPSSSPTCLVRSRILGIFLSMGIRKTVSCLRLWRADWVAEDWSMWPTYWRQLRLMTPTTLAVGWARVSEPLACVRLASSWRARRSWSVATSPPSSSASAFSFLVRASSSMILVDGSFHWSLGRTSTTTTSPSMARLMFSLPSTSSALGRRASGRSLLGSCMGTR